MFEQRSRIVPALCALIALALLDGCASIPEGHSAVDEVTFPGVSKIDDGTLEDKIATAASPKLLGLFQGVVYDYEVFNRAVLQRDLARVERFYRARGYYDVRVRAGRVLTTKTNHVRVEIVVEEGEPVVVGDVKIEGLDGLPAPIAAAARAAVAQKLVKGAPYDEDQFKDAETAARRALTDRGYAYAKVKPDAYVDVVHHVANTSFVVTAGPAATFGPIKIQGLEIGPVGHHEIPEAPLLRTISINEGDPYSTAAIDSATQALLDLEVFSAVEIVPELPESPPESHVVPLTVKVTPTTLRQLKLGGGVELDQLKTDVHAIVGWEDHNFIGGLRDFTVDFKPGVVLYPTRVNNLVVPNNLLPEARLRLQLRQPGFIESRTSLFIRPEVNVFPLLVNTAPAPDDPVVGYREFRGAVGLDRTLWKLFGSISYNVQVENPFVYKGALDPALSTLLIAYPELLLQFDFRDNRVHPHKGIFVGNDIQVAGGFFGGGARDVKIQPEVRTYLPLGKRVTFATRASVGFLVPQNYGDSIQYRLNDPVTDANREERVSDIQTTLFRGFFSGGPNSNRGFPLRGVSPHGVVPFLNPATAAQQVALSCAPSSTGAISTDPVCSIPIGGFTLWELSNEFRVNVSGPFSAATFCDMSDVSPRTANIRLDHLHLSCGLGARYETPIGPIRLDVGYRIQPLQVLGFANEDAVARANASEGIQPKIFNVPLAVAFGIGEAF